MSNKFIFLFLALFILTLNVYLLVQLRINYFNIESESGKAKLIFEKINRRIELQESLHDFFVPNVQNMPRNTTLSPIEEVKKLRVPSSPYVDHLNPLDSALGKYISKKPKYHNQFNYKFTINPGHKVCGMTTNGQKRDLTLVAFVPISVANFKSRLAIRHTWANSNLFNGLRVVFLTGLSKQDKVNKNLAVESEIYGDIVQANFQDTYKNLTIKTIMGFKWISQYCNNTKFVLKVDDDVVVNTHFLLKYLNTIWKTKPQNTFYCNVLFQKVVNRNRESKFYMSIYDYKDMMYPTYCRGAAYLFTAELVSKFVHLSRETKFFVFEDLFTGFMAHKLHSNYVNFTKFYFIDKKNSINFASTTLRSVLESTFFIIIGNATQFYPVWNKLYDRFTSYIFQYYFY